MSKLTRNIKRYVAYNIMMPVEQTAGIRIEIIY